jgi:NAD(P)-dependent dehydrogenase (short-subunit alcohol dehydrogenase family)
VAIVTGAAGGIGKAMKLGVLQRALAEDANPFGVGALATHSNLERPIIGAMMQS